MVPGGGVPQHGPTKGPPPAASCHQITKYIRDHNRSNIPDSRQHDREDRVPLPGALHLRVPWMHKCSLENCRLCDLSRTQTLSSCDLQTGPGHRSSVSWLLGEAGATSIWELQPDLWGKEGRWPKVCELNRGWDLCS